MPGGKIFKFLKGPAVKLGIKKLENQILKIAAKKAIRKSINQLNKLVKTGKTPHGIKRFDKGMGTKNLPYDEVHFIDGSSLYKNGTWRHHKGQKLTNEQINFLKENDWTIPS
jgi:hypothetical protein